MSLRRKIVAGNWKMNTTSESAMDLVKGIIAHLDKDTDVKVIVCPPAVHIAPIHHFLKDYPKLKVGAQNCSEHASGAYTGEVSAPMLLDVGCRYGLVGHSERRQYHDESNELVAQKFFAARWC